MSSSNPIGQMTLSDFRERNRISEARWAAARITWEKLRAIGRAHERRHKSLEDIAGLLAGHLQGCEAVHSVRWRVKSAEHLLEKIVRKRAQESEKYEDISPENYLAIVTDLVGVRALHLFKDDWNQIHKMIVADWDLLEPPCAYIREGDSPPPTPDGSDGLRVDVHPAGYRSVHYVISTRPLNEVVAVEVQVRTIFEEGWSEIDHRIRYPNFSEDEMVCYFLQIFNRLAGNADEMGTFVTRLAATTIANQKALQEAGRAQTAAFQRVEQLMEDMRGERDQSSIQSERILQLENELGQIRQTLLSLAAFTAVASIAGYAAGKSKGPVMSNPYVAKSHVLGMRPSHTVRPSPLVRPNPYDVPNSVNQPARNAPKRTKSTATMLKDMEEALARLEAINKKRETD